MPKRYSTRPASIEALLGLATLVTCSLLAASAGKGSDQNKFVLVDNDGRCFVEEYSVLLTA